MRLCLLHRSANRQTRKLPLTGISEDLRRAQARPAPPRGTTAGHSLLLPSDVSRAQAWLRTPAPGRACSWRRPSHGVRALGTLAASSSHLLARGAPLRVHHGPGAAGAAGAAEPAEPARRARSITPAASRPARGPKFRTCREFLTIVRSQNREAFVLQSLTFQIRVCTKALSPCRLARLGGRKRESGQAEPGQLLAPRWRGLCDFPMAPQRPWHALVPTGSGAFAMPASTASAQGRTQVGSGWGWGSPAQRKGGAKGQAVPAPATPRLLEPGQRQGSHPFGSHMPHLSLPWRMGLPETLPGSSRSLNRFPGGWRQTPSLVAAVRLGDLLGTPTRNVEAQAGPRETMALRKLPA